MAEPVTAARTLILMRHAAAGSAPRDHDRPLTPDGVRVATDAGRWIRGNLAPVDFVLCSSATRTRQTLSSTGLATATAADTVFSDELYGGGVDEILEQVAAAPAAARMLLVIGHAPTIPSTAWELVSQARSAACASGGAACASGGTDAGGTGPDRDADELRHFSAGSFAVLTTDADWADLAEVGAELLTVRHPVH